MFTQCQFYDCLHNRTNVTMYLQYNELYKKGFTYILRTLHYIMLKKFLYDLSPVYIFLYQLVVHNVHFYY